MGFNNKTKPILSLSQVLLSFTKRLQSLPPKKLQLILEWIVIWERYIDWESKFNPAGNRKYNKGDLVDVNFGFRVGSEHGGRHWAVVIENNNARSDNTVIVVPLSSLDENESEKDLSSNDVYLGVIPNFINQERAYAKVNQICAISKIRIISPYKKHHPVYTIGKELINEIEKKLNSLIMCKKPTETATSIPKSPTENFVEKK